MHRVYLPSRILDEIHHHISQVVENVAKVVNEVHNVILWVVSVLNNYDIPEVVVGMLSGAPAMEGYRVQLLSDFCDEQHCIEQIVDVLK